MFEGDVVGVLEICLCVCVSVHARVCTYVFMEGLLCVEKSLLLILVCILNPTIQDLLVAVLC